MEVLKDVGAERAVLAGICQHGVDAFVDVNSIITLNDFSDVYNQMLYRTIQTLFEKDATTIDIPSLISAGQSLGYQLTESNSDMEYIRSLFNMQIHLENVQKQAIKIFTLNLAKKAQGKHLESYKLLKDVTGNESIDEILSMSEKGIFELGLELNTNIQKGPEELGIGIEDYIQSLIDNPIENIGIPTPFPIYNSCIGGGIRPGVALVASRPKCQPLTAKILTPKGWVTYADIKKGDIICHPDGGTTKVVEVFETGIKDVYEFEFSDGVKTMACDEHRWKAKTKNSEYTTTNLKEMVHSFEKWYFPYCEPVEFETKETALDPYLVGYLLSRATSYGSIYILPKNLDKIKSKLPSDLMLKEKKHCNNLFSFPKKVPSNKPNIITEFLKQFNSKKERYIPDEYIFNSLEKRKQLLEGIKDSKYVTVSKNRLNKIFEFRTWSKTLAYSLLELIRSLSYHVHIYKSKTYYSVLFKTCRGEKNRYLKTFTTQGKLETRCIKVDAKDEMYITDDFIPTKNTGKTTFGKEVSLHVSGNLNIPVLFLDTEMIKNDQLNRSLSSLADIDIKEVETGWFQYSAEKLEKVKKAGEYIKNLPFSHLRIAGKDIDDVISEIRRWIYKKVGFDSSGKANPHLVIYDYFKLMNANQIGNNMAEHQVLGFQISKLSDFCGNHNTPVLAFVQVNRDGMTKDTSDIVSQSDRLLWLATSLTLFKRKTQEEIAEDGKSNGNMKLIPIECRYGQPLEEGDYVNLLMEHSRSKIKELTTNRASIEIQDREQSGFEQEEDDDNQQPVLF